MQYSNARSPILTTLFGISIFIKLLQPENVLSSIVVTFSGIVIPVKFVQL